MNVPRRTFLRLGLGALVAGAGCSRLGGGDSEAGSQAPDTPPTPATTGSAPAHEGHASDASSASGSRRSTGSGGRWSDPATWEGQTVPGGGEDVTLEGPVLLDVDAEVRSLHVVAGAALSFDPSTSATLRSERNVVVEGVLEVQPADAEVVHRLVLTGADESAFVGGGMRVLQSDVGLWVMDDGVLDVEGAPKLAWTRAAGALEAGQDAITLAEDPQGWRTGDELIVTATLEVAPEEDEERSHQVDVVDISAISGRTVTLARPLQFPHPAADVGRGRILTAEVLNLTRNVAIEGAPDGPAHVFIHSQQPQTVRYAALRYLGPRQPVPNGEREGDLQDVLGRYALHFHHCAGGSRGSLVEGVVARDLGSHAFVPHESNGTTWRECIAHDTHDDAYWWDPEESSSEVVFERCVASNVGANAPNRYTNGGFVFGLGRDYSNVVRGSVATNVSGDGFLWYEAGGIWVFEDCVAHNNTTNGIRVWQSTPQAHRLSRFVCYRNNGFGVDHGSYANAYHYAEGNMAGNGEGAVVVRAVSATTDDGRGLTFEDLFCDADGAEFALGLADGGPIETELPTVIRGCEFVNATRAGLLWDGAGNAAAAQVIDCTFDANELWLHSAMGANSRIELSDDRHGQVMLAPRGQQGEAVPSWNAVIVEPSLVTATTSEPE
jgi:G8 domain